MIASHSGVSGVREHPRHLFDQALQVLRRNGGLASVVGYDSCLRAVPKEKKTPLAALRADLIIRDTADWARSCEAGRDPYFARRVEINRIWPKASVRHLVHHIDYVVRLIGIDHVAIRSDFNAGGGCE